jgi:glycosyltransferase involved in cell wall biosynthesis
MIKNYTLKEIQQEIKKGYKFGDTIDICIVTFNRLEYLKKCVTSIIASTSIKFRIFVIDDGSTDGTKEWLQKQKKRGLIFDIILNKKNLGTATNFNLVIDKSDSPFFVMCNDDMYFHRYWDFAIMDIINKFDDCGIVSFYDYTRYGLDEGVSTIDDTTIKVPRTGLGAAAINRELFNLSGKFILPEGAKMGFFATPFCSRCYNTNIKRNTHYATVPNYVTNMDVSYCKLNENDNLQEYGLMRKKEKRGWGK